MTQSIQWIQIYFNKALLSSNRSFFSFLHFISVTDALNRHYIQTVVPFWFKGEAWRRWAEYIYYSGAY